jgi:hypothetical protein
MLSEPRVQSAMKLQQRFLEACRELERDVYLGFDSGSNLIGVLELSDGRQAQIHVVMVTDENEFIDVDGPTGCADDLMVTSADFKPES